jgi:hypothetical protein
VCRRLGEDMAKRRRQDKIIYNKNSFPAGGLLFYIILAFFVRAFGNTVFSLAARQISLGVFSLFLENPPRLEISKGAR